MFALTDDEGFIAKKARSQSRKIVENDKKFTNQSNRTENAFTLGHSLIVFLSQSYVCHVLVVL